MFEDIESKAAAIADRAAQEFFVYAGGIYCGDCGAEMREEMETLDVPPAFRDSDDFPAGPYTADRQEADSPDHCGSGANCVNAIGPDDLPGLATGIGVPIRVTLTDEGIRYVRDEMLDVSETFGGSDHSRAVVAIWAEMYPDAVDAAQSEREREAADAARELAREIVPHVRADHPDADPDTIRDHVFAVEGNRRQFADWTNGVGQTIVRSPFPDETEAAYMEAFSEAVDAELP